MLAIERFPRTSQPRSFSCGTLRRMWVLAGALLALGSGGCNPNSIGRPCVNASNTAPSGTQISSPALECPSRLCLIQAISSTDGTATASNTSCAGGRCTCTAECASDGDCDAETKEQCQDGFVCAVATGVTAFCCKKLCVCKTDLVQGFNATLDANSVLQPSIPFACDPTTNNNVTCKNVVHP